METGGKKKVALLFGSFNPIHEGHLAILRHIVETRPECGVRLVVSPQNPFKEGLTSSAGERLAAARETVARVLPQVEVSDVEFSLSEPYYTINTLRHLQELEPEKEFVLVVGGDNIASIERWHCGRELLKEFEVWVYPRPGSDAAAVCAGYAGNPDVKGVTLLDAPLYDISSTEIRAAASAAASGSRKEYDVIIIGGGITGAGVARDCALRGLKALLVEKGDITNGATGRNHGLLHSGARYAVNDGESAAECIRENLILKHIAPHCVERTEGLFLTLPEDDLAYQKTFIRSCRKAGIAAEAIDPKEALAMEPSANPEITGAVKVPDGSVDPFRLTLSNIEDARAHGAEILTFHEVTGFIKDGSRVAGVTLFDRKSRQIERYYAPVVVNAAGIWGQAVAKMAGADIIMFPAKGTLLVFGHRVNNVVLNRCRKSADGDILVPGESVTIIGTTSTRVPFETVDDVRPEPDEVDLLLREGSKLAPSLSSTRILRAYSGVRPLVAAEGDPSGRSISRGIVLLDHETRDNIKGFITITGGKLMTYRLMAEMATDLVCSKLGVEAACTTDKAVLPDPAPRRKPFGGELVCECENVTEEEIMRAARELGATDLVTLRRRTRLGMGTCQGQLCAKRAAQLLSEPDLRGFMNERWKGIYPVAWGEALREAQLAQWLYNDEI